MDRLGSTHVMSSVLKLMMVEMKFSRIKIPRSCRQSSSPSPSNTQMDSTASLTAAGGLARDRTSTRCCFLIALTAVGCGKGIGKANNSAKQNTSSSDKACREYPKKAQIKSRLILRTLILPVLVCTVFRSFLLYFQSSDHFYYIYTEKG